MTKDEMMAEWRKQRGAPQPSSEVGQRPLYESSIGVGLERYQPSAEPARFAEESVVCCKHGLKCSEFYTQKLFENRKISSLWPMFELLRRDSQNTNWVALTSSESASLRGEKNQVAHNANRNKYVQDVDNQYDNIEVKRTEMTDDLTRTAIEYSREASLMRQKPLAQKSVEKMFPRTASKLEMLCRFYLGQKPRSSTVPLSKVAQSFRLYHELPEDVNNLDNLKRFAPLYIMFINNDLECRRLRVQECKVHGKRRLFVDYGDKDAPKFKKLEHLVRHYANTFAYIDRKGRISRFPDSSVGVHD